VTASADDRVSLGSFLRRWRERTTPEQVGLRRSGPRRTPGLRREELALLAGISVDYLVRLEQNRDRHPSPAVLAALAHALRLGERERHQLFRLATVEDRRVMCSASRAGAPLRETTRRLLDGLATTPAAVLEASGDLAAWNDALAAVMGPTGLLDGSPPNLVRHVFDPAARRFYPAWEVLAATLVSHLQAAATTCAADDAVDGVVRDLRSAHPVFDDLWRRHDALELAGTEVVLALPGAGTLTSTLEVLPLTGLPDRWLVAFVPADDTTARRVDHLVRARPSVALAVPG
jgi:transcriptional regulator with XRE-family HTH domain